MGLGLTLGLSLGRGLGMGLGLDEKAAAHLAWILGQALAHISRVAQPGHLHTQAGSS